MGLSRLVASMKDAMLSLLDIFFLVFHGVWVGFILVAYVLDRFGGIEANAALVDGLAVLGLAAAFALSVTLWRRDRLRCHD